MQIPDGFLPLSQYLIYGLIILIVWIFTLKWIINSLEENKLNLQKIILFGALFIVTFLVQGINLPVPFGTSVHLVFAALIAILLRSPWAAVLLMTPLLFIQALFLGDGGITTYFANLLNIGVIGGFSGFYIYKFITNLDKKNVKILSFIGGGIAGFASVILICTATSIELALAGTFPLVISFYFMVVIYGTIMGIIEGFITAIICLLREALAAKGVRKMKY